MVETNFNKGVDTMEKTNNPVCECCGLKVDVRQRIVHKYKRCNHCGHSLQTEKEKFVTKLLRYLRKLGGR